MGNPTNSLSVNFLIPLWNRFAGGSTNRRIFGATLIVGFFTLLVKLASFLKELVIASTFGTGDALEAFIIANLIPAFIVNVVSGTSLNSAIMPTYIQVREQEGPLEAQRLLSGIITLTLLLQFATIAVVIVVGPYLLNFLGSGFNEEKIILSQKLLYFLLPIIVLNGLIKTLTTILNAEERFAFAAYIPAAVPVVSVLSILFYADAIGIYALAIGFVIGFGLQLFVLAVVLKKKNIIITPRWYGITPPVRQVIHQYFPMLTGALMVGSTTMVDQAMAAMLEPGSVASLTYGEKLPATLVGISAMALGTAVLPYYSKMVANENWQGIENTLRTYRWKIVQIAVPFTLVFYYFSEPIVQMIFQRGAFTVEDTVLVGQVQAMYVLKIPLFLLTTLMVRLVSSLKFNKLLMYGAMISVVVNIIFNFLLIKIMGLPGIALSTVLVYVVSFVYLSVGLRMKLDRVKKLSLQKGK